MRMWTYVVVIVFLAILFQMGGIPVGQDLLEKLGVDLTEGLSGFLSAAFWTKIALVLSGAVLGGIAIGFVTKAPTENYVVLAIILTQIIAFMYVLMGILNFANGIGGWVFNITFLILAPLTIGFAVATYEHFRGTA